jgi:hypothetical protein
MVNRHLERKYVKAQVTDKELEEFIKISKTLGLTRAQLIKGLFDTLKNEVVTNPDRKIKTKDNLKNKIDKIKEEKGYLSIPDLFKSIGSTFKDGCNDINNDINKSTKNNIIDIQNEEKKEVYFNLDNKVKE